MKALKRALVAAALLLQSWLNGGCSAQPYPPPAIVVTPPPPVVSGAAHVYSDGTFLCSATAIEPNVLTTAGHCIPEDESAPGFVVMADGSLNEVVKVWKSRSNDVALLTVKDVLPLVVPVAKYLPKPRDLAWMMGYGCDTHDAGMTAKLVLGVRVLTFLGRSSHGMEVYDGSACHGDSGGAIMNEHGELTGILVQGGENDDGVAFRVIAEPLSNVLDGLLAP